MLVQPARPPVPFDWHTPDYLPIFQQRIDRLRRLRANPGALPALKDYYREHPAQFISDWALTQDPRNSERGLPTTTPFALFPKQVEWVTWIIERWRAGEPGIVEKSRDSGASWLSIALACTLCLFHRGMVIGFGSRKQEYIDQLGSPKSLFEKARFFLSHLPVEFLDGWDRDKHAPYMRIIFPGSGSALCGEAGDGIGRGDRTSLYFIDEAAFLERPQLVDASLSATTNCRIDISTPNGRGNSFSEKRHSGKIKVFSFSWRDDPRKDDQWYRKQCRELDAMTLAQEVNCDYSASAEGVLIPSVWIEAAIDAHLKLGVEPTGIRRGGLDVADEGRDLNAAAFRYGILLEHAESWSGQNSNIYQTTIRMFGLCDDHRYDTFDFDSDGMGVAIRGDAEQINRAREADGRPTVRPYPFRGSGAVWSPDNEVVRGSGRRNKDFFANQKAQAWWSLRSRFEQTYRAVTEKLTVDPDAIISLDSCIGELRQLVSELSQVTYSRNAAGKVLVDKAPDGARSPNLADALVIAFCPAPHDMENWRALGEQP
jgi:phage terminase large subunit